jgi:hypothetical protein
MNDRSRAVTCQYKGGGHCSLSTKDSSELCHHHRRNSLQHTSGPGGAPKLRLLEATKKLVNGDTAAINSKVVLDHMPRVHRASDHVYVTMAAAATLPQDAIIWDGRTITLTEGQTHSEDTPNGILQLLKDGSTIRARYENPTHPDAHFELLSHAYTTRAQSARRLFAAQGMFDGLAERYDDKAEVLVQLPLNDNPDITVGYTSVSDGEVKVRITSRTADGTDQTETYSVFTSRFTVEDGDTVAPNNEVQMPGRVHHNGTSTDVPEAQSNQRAQLFHNITEALNVIDTYSITGTDGALYIPVGWMER